MAIQEQNPQRRLWDEQHARRNTAGPEGTQLRDIPTPAALHLASLLSPRSRVLEVGSANGRDARTWANLGHSVDCIDFSTVALRQLEELAKEQGISALINTHCHDVSDGSLPSSIPDSVKFNAFFARSALTISDQALDLLAENVTKRTLPGGVIMIEGRSPNDPKIQRSVINGNMADDSGHLRRVYTVDNMTALAQKFGWKVEQILENQEGGFESPLHMLRLVARRV
jgi:hypothetical protein